jgi:hypothetical protein
MQKLHCGLVSYMIRYCKAAQISGRWKSVVNHYPLGRRVISRNEPLRMRHGVTVAERQPVSPSSRLGEMLKVCSGIRVTVVVSHE